MLVGYFEVVRCFLTNIPLFETHENECMGLITTKFIETYKALLKFMCKTGKTV